MSFFFFQSAGMELCGLNMHFTRCQVKLEEMHQNLWTYHFIRWLSFARVCICVRSHSIRVLHTLCKRNPPCVLYSTLSVTCVYILHRQAGYVCTWELGKFSWRITVHNFTGHVENVQTRNFTVTLASPFLPDQCAVKHHGATEEKPNLVSGVSGAKSTWLILQP